MPEQDPKTNSGGNKERASGKATPKDSFATPEGICMLAIGVIFDTIGFIPIVNIFSNFMASAILLLWVWLSDRYKTLGRKLVLRYIATSVLEAIPGVSSVTPIIAFLGLAMGQAWPISWTGWVRWVLKYG